MCLNVPEFYSFIADSFYVFSVCRFLAWTSNWTLCTRGDPHLQKDSKLKSVIAGWSSGRRNILQPSHNQCKVSELFTSLMRFPLIFANLVRYDNYFCRVSIFFSGCLEPLQSFPSAVGRLCCHTPRPSGKGFSFFAAADWADLANTLCGSLVWSFVVITHCHPL